VGPLTKAPPSDRLEVLHVVATRQRRGAEMFAADLIGALPPLLDQRVAVLRDGPEPHVGFRAPVAVLPQGRLPVPGLGVRASTLLGLRRMLATLRPRVVHAHGGEPLKYAVLAGARRNGRILYRRIAAAPAAARSGARRNAHARLMGRADRVVTVSDSIRRETIEVFGVPEDRVVTVPRGIDAARLAPSSGREATRVALGIEPDARVVLSLGALGPEKDPLAHVEVARRVAARIPRLAHLVVGDGPLRGALEDAVRRDGLASTVRVVGARSDVGDILAASDVILLASRTEGMPGVLIEAGMTSVPSVAYAVGGVAEVVEDGATGILAPPSDVSALALGVERLLLDEELRTAMGAAARERCLARFEIGAVARVYLDQYESLMGGK